MDIKEQSGINTDPYRACIADIAHHMDSVAYAQQEMFGESQVPWKKVSQSQKVSQESPKRVGIDSAYLVLPFPPPPSHLVRPEEVENRRFGWCISFESSSTHRHPSSDLLKSGLEVWIRLSMEL